MGGLPGAPEGVLCGEVLEDVGQMIGLFPSGAGGTCSAPGQNG